MSNASAAGEPRNHRDHHLDDDREAAGGPRYHDECYAMMELTHSAAVGVSNLRDRLDFAARLKEERFDAALLLQNAFDAALLAWLAGIPVRIGYRRDARGLLLTHAVPVPEPVELFTSNLPAETVVPLA